MTHGIRAHSSIRRLIALAILAGITSAANTQNLQAAESDFPLAPRNLQCEYRPNPLAIDVPAPRLSWEVNDPRRGAIQSGYQVLVSIDPDWADASNVVWDTGKVDSAQSVHVIYAGRPLSSKTRYYWKVRTWDAAGVPSGFSASAWWETGLLDPNDWTGQWICSTRPQRQITPTHWGDWIWNAKDRGEQQSAYLRRTFKLEDASKVLKAEIKITVDDRFSLFLNGKPVGQRAGWNVVSDYNVTNLLESGKNVLAVKATNAFGGYGMAFAMRIELTDGQLIEIRSDPQWKGSSEDQPGWIGLEFDDTAWTHAVLMAKYGDPPWNELQEKVAPREALCLRKPFTIKKEVRRARAYACGLGIYELRLNGKKVGHDIFTPGWTHYYERLQYQTYDITASLRQGENVVGAVLGNGWWSGGMGWKGGDQYSDDDLRFLLQLDVEYVDGSTESVVTDGTWKAHSSPITRNTYYHGETYDARAEMPGWDSAHFNDGAWWKTIVLEEKAKRLVAQRCETIQVTEDIPVMQISEPEKGYYIFDFGQNAAGRTRLKVRNAEPGTRIRLRFGEELDPNGRLYRENYRSAEATDFYICKGSPIETWEPIFTYRGFRYCEVTGLPSPPDTDTLVMRVLHSATPAAGTFESSNWLIDRILHNVNWGLRSNIHSVPTDCPQRDERLGWMGDAQAFAHTSCFLRQMASFYTKWMFDVTDSQSPEGAVTDVSPAKVLRGAAKPGWGDAVVIVPYTIYRLYGDTRIIEENYDAMAGWVGYMRNQSKDYLYEEDGYGDWVAVETSPKPWIGSAFYYYSTKLLSEMAEAIGKTDDARQYAGLADKIANAFNAKHFDEKTSNYLTGTQTCNILPLFFGITPEPHRAAVLKNIVDDIKARGCHLSTGFMGTTYLMTLLSDSGQHELAFQLATQTTYPSWGHMILNGATTIWERWDTDKQGPQMNSRNHFAFGTVARWFYEDLAGINLDPSVPGFKRIIIHPRPVGDLTHAGATYPSPFGLIESRWEHCGRQYIQIVTIPANTTAEIHIPIMGVASPTIIDHQSGQILVREGQSATTVPGLRFVRMASDSAVFEAGAGHYEFSVKQVE